MRVGILGGLVLLAGCSLLHQTAHREWWEGGRYVCVFNEGLGSLAVYEVGRPARLGSVEPYHYRCVAVSHSQEALQLRVRIEGRDVFTPVVERDISPCWWMRIGTTPKLDVLSLEPADCPRRRNGS